MSLEHRHLLHGHTRARATNHVCALQKTRELGDTQTWVCKVCANFEAAREGVDVLVVPCLADDNVFL